MTLVVPWLSKGDQQAIFPNITFDKPEEQEAYVKEWARKRTGTDANFKVIPLGLVAANILNLAFRLAVRII